MSSEEKSDLLSIVVPTYNEEEVLNAFYERITALLDRLDIPGEIIFVNDGSTDNTLSILMAMSKADRRVCVLTLSRNFGQEIALTAGLDHARGTAIVPIDADLQDPPELIPTLIEKWREGYDVVYATRRERFGESWTRKTITRAFYQLMQKIGDGVSIPENTGEFRLMNRRALEAFCKMRERHRFLRGLFTLVGFRQTSVAFDRDPRFAGASKYNYWRLWNTSIEGVTSFTITPLKFATYMGLLVAMIAFLHAVITVFKNLVYGDPVAGYPSLMTAILFLGGIQLIVLGIIGEYLGRIFNETKQRPLYFVQQYIAADLASKPQPSPTPKEKNTDDA